MPTQQVYFGGGTSFSNANALYLDTGLQNCAPDGYYSDGVIVRRQLGCVLLPANYCNCGLPCSGLRVNTDNNATPKEYHFNYSSLNTGAIVVEIRNLGGPSARAFSFSFEYNGIVYNSGSGDLSGYIVGGVANQPTFVGIPSGLSACGLNTNNIFSGVQPFYWNGGTWVSSGPSFSLYNNPLQNVTTSPMDNKIVMVIPKINATPNNYSLKIQCVCSNADQLEVAVYCPQLLLPFKCSNTYRDPVGNCPTKNNLPNTFYHYPVNGFPNRIRVNDMVFVDSYGQYPLPDGYYRPLTTSLGMIFDMSVPNKNYMRVTNGVVTSVFYEPTCGGVWPI